MWQAFALDPQVPVRLNNLGWFLWSLFANTKGMGDIMEAIEEHMKYQHRRFHILGGFAFCVDGGVDGFSNFGFCVSLGSLQ